jgi:Ca2+-binding RTX toxin-like protein
MAASKAAKESPMRQFLTNLLTPRTRGTRSKRDAKTTNPLAEAARSAAPVLERLEGRTLMSISSPTSTLSPGITTEPGILSGTLFIQGTDEADKITVSTQPGKIIVTKQLPPIVKYIDTQPILIYQPPINTEYSAASYNRISFSGRDGNDTFVNNTSLPSYASGGEGSDWLVGGSGADSFNGGADDDDLEGRGGDDSLAGGAGDDEYEFIGSALGSDTVTEALGGGTDRLDFTDLDAAAYVDLALTSTQTVAAGKLDLRLAAPEVEDAWGSDFADTIKGNAYANALNGNQGADTLDGRAGPDTLNGGSANDTLQGGDGDDSLNGADGNDTINGGNHNDSLYGDVGNDTLDGDAGNDTLSGSWGADFLTGDAGNDTLNGHGDNDTLSGGTGVDNLNGGDGDDTLLGGAEDDTLSGGNHNDTLSGDAGNDTLSGNDGDDTLEGGADNDTLHGGNHNDTLVGDDGNDALNGNAGDDSLYGRAGIDTLSAGDGDDGLFGGAGADSLAGGTGDNRFLNFSGVAQDVVTDYSSNDAILWFVNGAQTVATFAGQNGSYTYAAGNWADEEVELLDSAFKVLHQATGNTKLLKDEDGDTLDYVRRGALIQSVGGSFTAGAWNSGTAINFPEEAFDNGDDTIRGTVFHEHGHNWDEEYNAVGWRALSGWVESDDEPDGDFVQGGDASGEWWHLASAQFASGYAMTNPNEDFSESFEAYFRNAGGFSTGPTIVATKNAFIQSLVNALD